MCGRIHVPIVATNSGRRSPKIMKPLNPTNAQAGGSSDARDSDPGLARNTPALPTDAKPSVGMARLALALIPPYRGWLLIVFIAMLIETAMSIAAPWPLKIILDNVV